MDNLSVSQPVFYEFIVESGAFCTHVSVGKHVQVCFLIGTDTIRHNENHMFLHKQWKHACLHRNIQFSLCLIVLVPIQKQTQRMKILLLQKFQPLDDYQNPLARAKCPSSNDQPTTGTCTHKIAQGGGNDVHYQKFIIWAGKRSCHNHILVSTNGVQQ